MARHWSVFTSVTESQGVALDRIARATGDGDGMNLLMRLTGNSRSKVGKMDRASLRPYLDEAFSLRDNPAAARDVIAAAQAVGLARETPAGIVADRVQEVSGERAAAIIRIRELMACHGITAGELS